jgi:hypothetical protein
MLQSDIGIFNKSYENCNNLFNCNLNFFKKKSPGLIPFNIRQKHDTRGQKHNKKKIVSFVEYIEVNVYGQQYRLGQKREFTINGTTTKVPFKDAKGKVQVYKKGHNLILSTDFGLTVSFDGNMRSQVILCDAYANSVCGLCGNADGGKFIYILKNNIKGLL